MEADLYLFFSFSFTSFLFPNFFCYLLYLCCFPFSFSLYSFLCSFFFSYFISSFLFFSFLFSLLFFILFYSLFFFSQSNHNLKSQSLLDILILSNLKSSITPPVDLGIGHLYETKNLLNGFFVFQPSSTSNPAGWAFRVVSRNPESQRKSGTAKRVLRR